MSNVTNIRTTLGQPPSRGEPPYDDGMETRVIKLEEFAQDTRDRLTRIESTMATKTDVSDIRSEMHKEFLSTTWKIVGSQAALVAAVYFIAKYVTG